MDEQSTRKRTRTFESTCFDRVGVGVGSWIGSGLLMSFVRFVLDGAKARRGEEMRRDEKGRDESGIAKFRLKLCI